jgi:hypothetical protein
MREIWILRQLLPTGQGGSCSIVRGAGSDAAAWWLHGAFSMCILLASIVRAPPPCKPSSRRHKIRVDPEVGRACKRDKEIESVVSPLLGENAPRVSSVYIP